MKVIDLKRFAPLDEGGIDFSGTSPGQDWWSKYLAWQASTPRNWIERKLEPLVQNPDSHLRIIDVATPEEDGVANGYPTAGMAVWWTIICLDGAPERMRYQVKIARQRVHAAAYVVVPAEDRFRALVAAELDKLSVQPVVQVLGDWRDGMIVGYEVRESASDAVVRVSNACAAVNTAEQLPWTRQYHVRAGIGRSVRGAFTGLLHTRRNQLSAVLREPNQPSLDHVKDIVTVALHEFSMSLL